MSDIEKNGFDNHGAEFDEEDRKKSPKKQRQRSAKNKKKYGKLKIPVKFPLGFNTRI